MSQVRYCDECSEKADCGQGIANYHPRLKTLLCDLCFEDAQEGKGRHQLSCDDFVSVRI